MPTLAGFASTHGTPGMLIVDEQTGDQFSVEFPAD